MWQRKKNQDMKTKWFVLSKMVQTLCSDLFEPTSTYEILAWRNGRTTKWLLQRQGQPQNDGHSLNSATQCRSLCWGGDYCQSNIYSLSEALMSLSPTLPHQFPLKKPGKYPKNYCQAPYTHPASCWGPLPCWFSEVNESSVYRKKMPVVAI